MEEQRKLLGLVEIGRVLARKLDQLVQMLGTVIAAVGLHVVQAGGRDQRAMREQPHQRSITLRMVSNTFSNMAVVSLPVFVL